MSKGQISRGDLLRAAVRHGGKLPSAAAASLGFLPRKSKPPKEQVLVVPPLMQNEAELATDSAQTLPPKLLLPVPFWQPQEFRHDEDAEQAAVSKAATACPPSRAAQAPPPYQYLALFSDLVPRLRTALAEHGRCSRLPDIPQIAGRLSRAEVLHELPRVHRPGWGASLHVIEDRSDYLAPYVRDQAWLQTHLSRLYPQTGFFPVIYHEGLAAPQVLQPDGRASEMRLQPGEQVLVLSDLGCLAKDGGRAAAFWQTFGEKLRSQGILPLALLPCAPSECPEALSAQYRLLSWEHPAPQGLTAEELEERGQELLTHLAVCPRIEPALLRAIRLHLGQDRFPARLETWVWQHAVMDGSDLVAAALSNEATRSCRKHFQTTVNKRQAAETLRLVREGMATLPYELWLETVLNFSHWNAAIFTEQERQDAVHLLNWLACRVCEAPLSARSREWLHGFCERLDDAVRDDQAAKAACWRLDRYFAGQDGQAVSGQPVQVHIRHLGDALLFSSQQQHDAGSPAAAISSGDGLLVLEFSSPQESGSSREMQRLRLGADKTKKVKLPDQADELRIRTDREQLILRRRTLADYPWADALGRDRFGLWAEFVVEGKDGGLVRQRMRWIPPGAIYDKTEQNRITVNTGFWLFDTPITQRLWRAVTGIDSSDFQNDDQIVQGVSQKDCDLFLQVINQQMPELRLTMPTDSEWKYSYGIGADSQFEFYNILGLYDVTRELDRLKISENSNQISIFRNNLTRLMIKNEPRLTGNYLSQATCAVIINGSIAGAAWLVSNEGHLLTAGHLLGTHDPVETIEVQFPNEPPLIAYKIAWGYQYEMGIDFAMLKLKSRLVNRHPLPVSLAESVSGTLRFVGYGETPRDQTLYNGHFIGYSYHQNNYNYNLFWLTSILDSKKRHSGCAIFSDELQAIVGIIVSAITSEAGVKSASISAMPLFRIAKIWENLDLKK